jgi:hypothetical protein
MNAFFITVALLMGAFIAFWIPTDGQLAVFLALILATIVGLILRCVKEHKDLLLMFFITGLISRVVVALGIYLLNLQAFFGLDSYGYDLWGYWLLKYWQGENYYKGILPWDDIKNNWGMQYLVACIYALVGRNTLAVQLFNAVIGATTAPVIFLCTKHIYHNVRVATITAYFVAFYPSLVLWSSQGLKDGLIVFLLAVLMLITLKLAETISFNNIVLLLICLLAVFSLRFYIFYMVVAAISGTFIIGTKSISTQSLIRQFAVIIAIGIAMTYIGVLRTASTQLESYTNLETLSASRSELANTAQSGFGRDVDVSTASGAISFIPIGLVYLLFAPFPWELANLRQMITLPEMIIWWCSFPILIVGLWFTLKYRLRQALPILIFISGLTLAYSMFQGNIGTAYRQRSQLLVFYFIFVAVGIVLFKEKHEERKRREAITQGYK